MSQEHEQKQIILGSTELQQTLMMLNLSIAQIDLSISEGGFSVNKLIDSFTYMAEQLEEMQVSSREILEKSTDSELAETHNTMLMTQAGDLGLKMHQAVIAFQFYDRLSQRLHHVSKGLSGLGEIVSHEMRVADMGEWEAFKESVRISTSMREEQELYELIFGQNVPTDEAIDIMRERMVASLESGGTQEEEEIELF
jgi:secreted PhoX family phosphatase